MKIAQVTCVFRPYKGGIGEVAYFYARELVRQGNNVTVFAPRYKKNWQQEEILDGIKVNRLNSCIKWGNAAVMFQLFWKLRSFDVVHVHYPFFGSAEIIWLYSIFFKPKQQKIVYTYHMDTQADGFLGSYFKFHQRFITPFLLRKADAYIATSFDYIKNCSQKNFYFKHKEKFHEIPLGVDEIFTIRKIDEDDFSKFTIPTNKKVILFVGGLDDAHYFKGLEYMIEAMEEIDAHLLVVGKGNRKKYFEEKVRNLKIESKVTFTGFISDDELLRVYTISDVCVLPSINMNEAFGIVLAQASACGKPIIASNLPGVRTVVQDGINGLLIEPKNLQDLIEKVNTILSDNQLQIEMGQNGYKNAQKMFNWKIIGEKLYHLYKNL